MSTDNEELPDIEVDAQAFMVFDAEHFEAIRRQEDLVAMLDRNWLMFYHHTHRPLFRFPTAD